MEKYIEDILQRKLTIASQEGEDKVRPLRELISRYVRPGMTLHFCITHSRPSAVIYELARQFWGKRPAFTIVSLGLVNNYVIMVHGELVKKCVATFCGDSYPTPGPNPVYQRAFREGRIEMENWSILTLPQRLLAGALGLKWLPTRSLMGSTMAEENRDSFQVIEDPLNRGEKLGLVRALRPDISFVHGLAADRYGNTIITPPWGENVYGPLSSHKGAIVTVEKVVDTNFIRRYNHLVRLPGYAVLGVAEVPFGVHPGGLNAQGIEGLYSYADDYDFIEMVRDISRDSEKLDRWIKDWVLDCQDFDQYLEKLGTAHLLQLKGKAQADSWVAELFAYREALSAREPYNSAQMMVCTAAHLLEEKIRKNHYRTILAGIGASNLAAWLANYKLKGEGYDVELMAEIGFYGYSPRPADPFIFNFRNIPTCKLLSDIHTIMAIFMGGAGGSTIGSIGAGQIDRFGNTNSTRMADGTLLVGSGGSNDVASTAREVLVTIEQSPQRLVERVSYITCPGERIKTLVTTAGVYEKLEGEKEFTLTRYYPDESHHPEQIIRQIKDSCGWELRVSPHPQPVSPPSPEELLMLRLFDPRGQFLSG